MVKKICLAVTAFVLLASGSAVSAEREKNGFCVSPAARLVSADIWARVFTGLQGGWIINHKLLLGAGGYGLIPDGSGDRFMGYGGALLGYVANPEHVIHATIQLVVGIGTRAPWHADPDYWPRKIYADRGTFLVIEPLLGIESNVSRVMRVEVGGSFLYAGASGSRFSNDDLTGLCGTFALKFGRF